MITHLDLVPRLRIEFSCTFPPSLPLIVTIDANLPYGCSHTLQLLLSYHAYART